MSAPSIFTILAGLPWDDVRSLIDAAAGEGVDEDEAIERAADFLDAMVDWSQFGPVGSAFERVDDDVLECAIRIAWRTQSPTARAHRRAVRDAGRQAREAVAEQGGTRAAQRKAARQARHAAGRE